MEEVLLDDVQVEVHHTVAVEQVVVHSREGDRGAAVGPGGEGPGVAGRRPAGRRRGSRVVPGAPVGARRAREARRARGAVLPALPSGPAAGLSVVVLVQEGVPALVGADCGVGILGLGDDGYRDLEGGSTLAEVGVPLDLAASFLVAGHEGDLGLAVDLGTAAFQAVASAAVPVDEVPEVEDLAVVDH